MYIETFIWYSDGKSHELLSWRYARFRVHHTHVAFVTQSGSNTYGGRKRRQERSCDSDATLFSPFTFMESKIHGVSKEDKMKVKPCAFCNIVVEKKGALRIEQIVTTLLGTYLSDEMNFWFTFTSCRYSVSMDTTLTYGKKREIFTLRSKLNTTKH